MKRSLKKPKAPQVVAGDGNYCNPTSNQQKLNRTQ